MDYQQNEPTSIGEGSHSAVKMATKSVFHKRSKNIDTRNHCIRDKVANNTIQLKYTQTNEMGADILTKCLPQSEVERYTKNLLEQTQITLYETRRNLSRGISI